MSATRRRTIASGVACLAAVSVSLAVIAAAEARAGETSPPWFQGGCRQSGTDHFRPALSARSRRFSYAFTGSLTLCYSRSPGAPRHGEVTVGSNGLPAATGTGSCAYSTSSGITVAAWSDGAKTVAHFTATAIEGVVLVNGTVLKSFTYRGRTWRTTERLTPPGARLGGLDTSVPLRAQGCLPGAPGVSTSEVNGVVGLGES